MPALAAFIKRTIITLGFTGTSNSSKPYEKILTHKRATRPGSFEYVTIVNHNPTTPTKHTIYALQGRERGLDARGVGQWEELAVKYNVHIVLHNYPGYGRDYIAKPRVRCDEVTLKEDCVELLEMLKSEPWFNGTEVTVLGNSIGTGPAMWMASENSRRNLLISKLVLISPYTNLGDFLFRPLALLLRRFFPIADVEPFPTLLLASQLRDIHVLTVHGDQDKTIPFSHFEAINSVLEANSNISGNKAITFAKCRVPGASHRYTRPIAEEVIFEFVKGDKRSLESAIKRVAEKRDAFMAAKTLYEEQKPAPGEGAFKD